LKHIEDGAPVHQAHFSCNGEVKLVWLANSQDLNPIENLWKIVKGLLQHHPNPKNQGGNGTHHSINMGYNIFGATPNFD
jgi:hypothetical protein